MSLVDRWRRFVCRVLGHRWATFRPKNGAPVALIFRDFVMCRRCGKLDR